MTYYHIVSVSGNVMTYPGGSLTVDQLPPDFAPEIYRISVETFTELSEPDEFGERQEFVTENVDLVVLADITPYTPSDYLVVVDERSGSSIRRSDGASIPLTSGNRDYQEFLVVDTELEYCPREYHPTEEEKWVEVRAKRDRLLAKCDWTQVVDAPLTDEQKTAWQAYRQALRDLPQDYATPDAVVWPEESGGV